MGGNAAAIAILGVLMLGIVSVDIVQQRRKHLKVDLYKREENG
jgi:hypothetical protein